MTEEELHKRRLEITDEIHVAGEQARKSIDVAKEEAIRVRRRDGYWWFIMVLTSASFAAVSVLFSWHNTNETELKFCKLMNASVTQAEKRLAGYLEAPPTTDAGREQQQQAQESVLLLMDLRRSLGCTIS